MKVSDLQQGDRLTDFEFWGCVPVRAIRVVQRDRFGFFVRCREGRHYLSGQEGEDGELCGCEIVSLAPRPGAA